MQCCLSQQVGSRHDLLSVLYGLKNFMEQKMGLCYTKNFRFDVITMLASIEHIPVEEHTCIVNGCWKYLKPGGRVIITVPHPRVDRLLELLTSLNILEGFSIQEHYGFNPQWLPDIFNGWKLLKKERWELGCNYLFIFEKPKTSSKLGDR